jgi:hypothetical protein
MKVRLRKATDYLID